MAEHARAVIIGGGVGGTSIAYHLAERGWTDIVLVDRAELTSGSTFHSAGLVGQLRGSVTLTRMIIYSVELYRRLAAETGVDPSWREVGSLRLASTKARYEELQRQAGWARTFGLPLELVSAKEAQARFPLMTARRRAGRRMAADRRLARPVQPRVRARGRRPEARRADPAAPSGGGDRRPGRARDRREAERGGERVGIDAEVVVNAGGMYAPEIGRLAGVTVPLIPMAHQYLLTGRIDGRHARAAAAPRP